MKTSTLCWLFALGISIPALAEIRTLVEAKETSTAYMTVPTTDNARLIFKSCDECDYISVRLTPETRYYVNGELLTFEAFRKEFTNFGRSKENYALVSYETKTNTVKSVRLAERPDHGSIQG